MATILLAVGMVLAGAVAYTRLPVSPLPQVEFPVISVTANLPGANPETMAATVATPLERALGSIAGINEITSRSSLGSTRVTLQFDLSRNIDDAAIEVQAAINAARSQLPSSLPDNPTYRKVNPADSPIMVIALTSPTARQSEMFDVASTVLAQKLVAGEGGGAGDRRRQLAACGAGGGRPCGAEPARPRPRPGARGACGHQLQPAEGRWSRKATASGGSTPTTRRAAPANTCR